MKIKDTYGRELKENDTCLFWNDDFTKRVIYKFFEYQKDKKLYVSIDVNDDNDLSWWKHCERYDI